MSAIISDHDNNILLGSGHLYIDVLDDADATQGERYLGDAVSANLTITTERVQVFSGSGEVAVQLVNKVRSISRSLSLTLHDVSMENLALLVGGGAEVATVADGAFVGVAQAEAIKIRRGFSFQLGVTAARPAGVRAVKDTPAATKTRGIFDAGANSVVLTTAALAPTAANTISRSRYRLDAAAGRIHFPAVDTGAEEAGKAAAALPANGGTVYVHYTPDDSDTASRKQVAAPETPEAVRAAIRYIEQTATGDGRNYYAPLCSVGASGDFALMSRETEQQIQIVAEILEPGGGRSALLIDGQAQ